MESDVVLLTVLLLAESDVVVSILLNDLLELYVLLPITDADLQASPLIDVELFNARTWCPTNFFLVIGLQDTDCSFS